MEEEPEVPSISEKPDEKVPLEKRYYHGVFLLPNFNKGGGVDRKEQQADMEPDTDEEQMEDVRLDKKRQRPWRVFFEGNDLGVDDEKLILHAKK